MGSRRLGDEDNAEWDGLKWKMMKVKFESVNVLNVEEKEVE